MVQLLHTTFAAIATASPTDAASLEASLSSLTYVTKLVASHPHANSLTSPRSSEGVSPPSRYVAAALSQSEIKLYILQNDYSLYHYQTYQTNDGHNVNDIAWFNASVDSPSMGLLTSTVTTASSSDNLTTFISTSESGIQLWDVRSPTAIHSQSIKNRPVLSVATSPIDFKSSFSTTDTRGRSRNPYEFVLGCEEGAIFRYDVRSLSQPLQTLEELHNDHVTSVLYSPVNTRIVTGGADGYINIFDPYLDEDHDDFLEVGTVTADVDRLGFFGPSYEHLYAITTTSVLEILNVEDGATIATFPTLRDQLSNQCGHRIDYLIDCYADPTTQNLFLISGNNNGSLLLSKVESDKVTPLSMFTSHSVIDYDEVKEKDINVSVSIPEENTRKNQNVEGKGDNDSMMDDGTGESKSGDDEKMGESADVLSEVVKPGHVACVRTMIALPTAHNCVWITGAEDGKVCTWSPNSVESLSEDTKLKRKTDDNMIEKVDADTDKRRKYRPY